ncbi:MAG: DUF3536 domain-containing protein, partial [Deltaproteobacteria bacterium]|nr:DUF3536 domain-containing protein [Deltaproteobacteria bacterium]
PKGFGVFHLGDHNVYCGVKDDPGEDTYEAMVKEVSALFSKADITGTIRRMDKYFGDTAYSLGSLFRDERRKILGKILESTLADAEDVYRHIYDDNAPLLRFLKDRNLPAPGPLQMAAEFVLNGSLGRAFQSDAFDPDLIGTLLREAQVQGVHLDGTNLEFIFRKRVEKMAEECVPEPADLSRIRTLKAAMDLLESLPFHVNLWKVQNVYDDIRHSTRPHMKRAADQGNENALDWITHFNDLGEALNMRVKCDE